MDKTSDRLTVPRRLAGLAPGTRVRLFHREQGLSVATSGTLLSVAKGEVRVARDGGGEAHIALATVTRFYLPPSPPPMRPTQADFEGFVARARRAILGLRRPHAQQGAEPGAAAVVQPPPSTEPRPRVGPPPAAPATPHAIAWPVRRDERAEARDHAEDAAEYALRVADAVTRGDRVLRDIELPPPSTRRPGSIAIAPEAAALDATAR